MMKQTLLLLLSAIAIATPAMAFSVNGVINARKTVIQNEHAAISQQRQKDVIVMRNLRDVADWADYGGYGGYDGYGEIRHDYILILMLENHFKSSSSFLTINNDTFF